MRYSFHPEAQSELVSAVDYYESCRSGLGLEFAEEVYGAIQRVPVPGRPIRSTQDDVL